MNIISEGTLSYECRISNILKAIRQQPSSGLSLLSLSSPDHLTDGIISIRDSRFITGAISNTDGVTGYSALKGLLSLALGTYSLSQLEPDQLANFDQDINIDLDRVIAVVPSLPENLSELFDQESLLDKVFSQGQQKKAQVVPPIITTWEHPISPPAESSKAKALPPKTRLLESLIAANSSKSGEVDQDHASFTSDTPEDPEARGNFNSFSWFGGLTRGQKLLSALMIVIIALGLFWLITEVKGLVSPKVVPYNPLMGIPRSG